MSKKYIIEIEDEPFVRRSALHGEEALYRAVGFRSLVFDQNGLNNLKPRDDLARDYIERVTNKNFEVGDEVVDDDDIKYTVLDVDDDVIQVLSENGCVEQLLCSECVKTGRRFADTVDTLLNKMRAWR